MGWNANYPTGKTKIKDADNFIVVNWGELDSQLSETHSFPETYGSSSAGHHKPGETSVCFVGTTSDLAAMDDVLGGIAFATDVWAFYVNNGAGFVNMSLIPSGTKMLFYNAVAPIGWTIVSLTDNLVFTTPTSSEGGSAVSGGTWTIGGLTSQHKHDYSEIVTHNHPVDTQRIGSDIWGSSSIRSYNQSNPATAYASYEGVTDSKTANNTSTNISSDGAWRPASARCIVCTKD